MSSAPVEAPESRDADSVVHALKVVRERWWIIALTTVGCMVLAIVMSLSRSESFRSTASVQFNNSQVTDSLLNITRGSSQPERDAATQVLVATSPDVAERAGRTLESELDRDELLAKMTVEAAENADIVSISAVDEDPRVAARLANAFAQAYIEFNRQSDVAQLDASAKALEARSAQLPEGSPERAENDQQLAALQGARGAASSGLRVIGTAQPSTEPVSPLPRRDAILGLIFGLVLGLSIAFLLDLFDRRVKSVDEFERLYGMRTLASIPQLSFSARTQEDRAVGFEPYRVLRNAIGFAELTRDLDAIMVTSAMPAEGKSSVSMNLARAIALSGQRVVLVECDLRRPAVAKQLGIDDTGGGLTTALVGRRPVADLLRPVTPGLAHFSVLPSGPLPPNAAELLRSPRMAALLAELKRDGTRVILDSPPLLPVADAQGLLDHPQIDAALLVARAMQTTREEARRARAVLDQHRLQPLGLVVTGLKEERSYGYYGADPGGVPSGRKPAADTIEPEKATRT